MRTLFEMDRHDYDPSWPRFTCPSVRAVIRGGDRVAMAHSLKYDYYKFPGGGIEAGESRREALVREVREETGLNVIESTIVEFGSVMRRWRGSCAPEEIFEQENFYYFCETEETAGAQRLDAYEAEAEFVLEFVPLEQALVKNRSMRDASEEALEMLEREARVLELLLKAQTEKAAIRTMTPEDYDAVYELWRQTPGMGLNTTDDSREGIRRFLKRNPATCFAAEAEGTVIGAVLAGHDGRRGYLYHTAVRPEYRKRGIGSGLVKAAMEALEREGIQKAALVVFAKNQNGNAFWERLGFTERNDLTYRNKNIHPLERIDT